MAGIIIAKQERTAKSGNRFAFCSLSDASGVYEVTPFQETLAQARELLVAGTAVLLNVDVQRQGVAIARAVINDPPILLLDEPTSSMDFSSEDDIKRRLTEYAKGKTVILISHRTSLLDLADRIIVIDGGRIMADGPKEQVVTALRQGRIGKAA